MFQFVPSRGGQREQIATLKADKSFNSCPRAEGNIRLYRVPYIATLFQFVPSRGGQQSMYR